MKNRLIFIAALTCLISCTKQHTNAPAKSQRQTLTSWTKAEEMFPGETGAVKSGNYYGQSLDYQVIHGTKIFQGDIVLTDRMSTSPLILNSADRPRMSTYLWPNKTIYYTIDASVTGTNLTIVNNAISYWNTHTIITLTQRNNPATQPDYVTFVFNLSGPSSTGIGRVGGQQFIYVAGVTGNIIHEIGHIVGLWHEHTRTDRDAYVTINYANMSSDPGVTINYKRYVDFPQAGIDFYGPLDYHSIMMYDSRDFSINGGYTMTKTNGDTIVSQRASLTSTDIAAVKFIYTPAPIVTFNVSSTNTSQTTGYSMSDGTLNLASGRTVGQNMTNTILTSFDQYSTTLSPYTQIPSNSSATITMTIINGYHPFQASLNAGNGAIWGVISGNTITYNGVNLSSAPRTVTIILQ